MGRLSRLGLCGVLNKLAHHLLLLLLQEREGGKNIFNCWQDRGSCSGLGARRSGDWRNWNISCVTWRGRRGRYLGLRVNWNTSWKAWVTHGARQGKESRKETMI